jgi:hypothetical protein
VKEMAKTLELQFTTEFGKTASLSVDNPKEPIDEEVVKLSMASSRQHFDNHQVLHNEASLFQLPS